MEEFCQIGGGGEMVSSLLPLAETSAPVQLSLRRDLRTSATRTVVLPARPPAGANEMSPEDCRQNTGGIFQNTFCSMGLICSVSFLPGVAAFDRGRLLFDW
jgi:hypothetical protein